MDCLGPRSVARQRTEGFGVGGPLGSGSEGSTDGGGDRVGIGSRDTIWCTCPDDKTRSLSLSTFSM